MSSSADDVSCNICTGLCIIVLFMIVGYIIERSLARSHEIEKIELQQQKDQ